MRWAGNVLDTDTEDPIALADRMEAEFSAGTMFDTEELAKAIQNTVYAAVASGKATKAADLISKEGRDALGE